ncbi:MAG: hypothetical protein KGH98_04165 [Candidatus Micrarchaeota archaeon]|nr:hypothetical protein [Candidatus Micrarchaeota archaeon]
MPARIYECGREEAQALKKALEYDPYLDPKVIPPSKYDEKDLKKLTPEQRKEYDEEQARIKEALKKLNEDPYSSVIFTRQDYDLRDGTTMGMPGKFYLYLNANEEFLALAEGKLAKDFKSVKRADPETEKKVIEFINEEESKANVGIGSIFGG